SAWDLAFFERALAFGGHGMLGLDVPRIGRLRGDITPLPPPRRQFLATPGRGGNYEPGQAPGGGGFGNALPRAAPPLLAPAAPRRPRAPTSARLPVPSASRACACPPRWRASASRTPRGCAATPASCAACGGSPTTPRSRAWCWICAPSPPARWPTPRRSPTPS